jgi:hypothetical protein
MARNKRAAAPNCPQLAGFNERGLPGGGLWLQLRDCAGVFGVTVEAVRKWRTNPAFAEELEFEAGGRVWLNLVGLVLWRLDQIRQQRGCSAVEAVEHLRPCFRGLPMNADGKVRGWFAGEAAPWD